MSLGPLLRADLSTARAFILLLRQNGLCWNTIGLYQASINGLYEEIEGLGIQTPSLFRNPSLRPPRGSRRPTLPTQAMTSEQARKLLEVSYCNVRDYAMMCLLLGGGMRRNEILALTKDDIFQKGDVCGVILRKTKNHTYREHSLPDWANSALGDHVASLAGHRLFPISSVAFHKMFCKYIRLAGIDGRITIHSCRTTAINELLDAGWDHRKVQLFSGHASVRMVEQYDRRRLGPEQNPGRTLSYGR